MNAKLLEEIDNSMQSIDVTYLSIHELGTDLLFTDVKPTCLKGTVPLM